MTFVKGQSGNPAGRKPGSKNRQTLLEQALAEGEAEAIMRILIEKAREGDSVALRLCAERLVPRAKAEARVIPFELPPINSVRDLLSALAGIAAGVGGGEVSIEEAAGLSQVAHRWTEAVQVVEFDERLKKVEADVERRRAGSES